MVLHGLPHGADHHDVGHRPPDHTHGALPGLRTGLGAAVAAEGEVPVGLDDAGDDQEVDHHGNHASEPQRHLCTK